MTNDLLKDWKLKIKFVDDTTPFEILPRNSMSLLNFAANDTQYFSKSHDMKLNPPKCKQMVINFMHNHNFSLNPIYGLVIMLLKLCACKNYWALFYPTTSSGLIMSIIFTRNLTRDYIS